MRSDKIRVLLIFGGKSTEHEVSCRSAAFILKNLNPKKYEVSVLAIDKAGVWLPQNTDTLRSLTNPNEMIQSQKTMEDISEDDGQLFMSRKVAERLVNKSTSKSLGDDKLVVFPVIHGTFGEDGTLQGLLEQAELAFVGPDTTGSAIAMDKGVSKRLVRAAGLKVGPFTEFKHSAWKRGSEQILLSIETDLMGPWFIKPARLGSSVGISKVKSSKELRAAIDLAFTFDEKVLVETGIDAREIEVAVLGGDDPQASVVGEIIASEGFYDYDAKYISATAAEVVAPAKIALKMSENLQRNTLAVFKALELYGMARIDWFLDRKSKSFFFNEANTIPGFTSISQYPKLWAASGVKSEELVDRLIDSAIQRQENRRALVRTRVTT